MASYIHTNYGQIKNNSDHVYFDLTARSYASNRSDISIPITFNETRSSAILNDISQYALTICRFKVDTFDELFPVLFFQTEIGTNDRDLGVYRIILEYNDGIGGPIIAEKSVMWVPQLGNISPPAPPSEQPNDIQANSPYYYCYNFSYFLVLVNNALKAAMDEFKLTYPGIFDSTYDPPFLVWNKDNTATLYALKEYYDIDTFPRITISFNKSLYSLFSSFPSTKGALDVNNNINYSYFKLLVKQWGGVKVTKIPFNVSGMEDFIYVDMEYSTVDQFSPVSTIMFTTSTIPILPTSQSVPKVIIDGQPNQLTNTFDQFSNVLTDLSTDELAFKPSLIYTPTVYRIIDLANNNQPLYTIDISVFWTDKLGFHHPLNLAPNSSVSLKLLFIKKKYLI